MAHPEAANWHVKKYLAKNAEKVEERRRIRKENARLASEKRHADRLAEIELRRSLGQGKLCSRCNIPKEEAEFNKSSTTLDGLNAFCRGCSSLVNKLLHVADPEKKNARSRARYHSDPKKFKEQNKVWKQANLKKLNAYYRNRHHTNVQAKLGANLRTRIRGALKADHVVKSASLVELLGCPVVWLEVHLESLFKPGMTWENHGPVWHIDHIKPCAAFDLTDPEQQKICFHWTNLQPLFALDNIRKSDKYEN